MLAEIVTRRQIPGYPSYFITDDGKVWTENRNRRWKCLKLSFEKVREIRELLRVETRAAIAAKFGVSVTVICNIANRKRWQYVD